MLKDRFDGRMARGVLGNHFSQRHMQDCKALVQWRFRVESDDTIVYVRDGIACLSNDCPTAQPRPRIDSHNRLQDLRLPLNFVTNQPTCMSAKSPALTMHLRRYKKFKGVYLDKGGSNSWVQPVPFGSRQLTEQIEPLAETGW